VKGFDTVGHGDHLFDACARLARERGWPAEQRDRPEGLLTDEGRRRAPFERPRRIEFVQRALAETLEGRGATGLAATSDPDEMEVRVVALMMAEGLAPPG
jgi:hypothetical protein